MNNKFIALLLLLSPALVVSVCLAQSVDQEQVWLPPSWVWGSGYTPADYPSSASGWAYDPFYYYSYQGKTYYPYRYAFYSYPGGIGYPYDYAYLYPYGYRYPYMNTYPYNYYSSYK